MNDTLLLLPVRCFSCGKVIGDKWDPYVALLSKDTSERSVTHVITHKPDGLSYVQRRTRCTPAQVLLSQEVSRTRRKTKTRRKPYTLLQPSVIPFFPSFLGWLGAFVATVSTAKGAQGTWCVTHGTLCTTVAVTCDEVGEVHSGGSRVPIKIRKVWGYPLSSNLTSSCAARSTKTEWTIWGCLITKQSKENELGNNSGGYIYSK